MSTDFIVAGGGIGGAVLAALLARGARKVIVLEKSIAPAKLARPEVLWPATMQVLFSLISRGTLEEDAVLPMRGVQFQDRGQLVSLITPQLLREAGVQPWFTDPSQTRERLLALDGFELRRGVEVIAVLKERDRVVGVRTRDVATAQEHDVLADWTVGDDGAESAVRKACGIEIQTRMFPVDFLCFGFEWPRALPAATGRVWLNRAGAGSGIFALAALPVSLRKGAALVVVRPGIFDDVERARPAWERLLAIDSAIHEVVGERKFPEDFVRVRRPWGHARHYGVPGALLMGDAAHPVSPAGGQGANMSVADACALAQAALANSPDLLREYERQRRGANERSIGPTRWAARIWGLPEWCFPGPLLLAALHGASRSPWLLRHALRSASTAFLSAAPRR